MSVVPFTPKGRDGFKLHPRSDLRAEHSLLNDYVEEVLTRVGAAPHGERLGDTNSGARIAALEPEAAARIVLALVERLVPLGPYAPSRDLEQRRARDAFELALRELLMRRLPLTETHLCAVLDWMLAEPPQWQRASLFPYVALARTLESQAAAAPVASAIEQRVRTLAEQLGESFERETRKAGAQLAMAVERGPKLPLVPGEAWSDAVLAHVRALPDAVAAAWHALLAHCGAASGGKPSAKWRGRAAQLIEAVGPHEFSAAVLEWFPLVDEPRTQPIAEWPSWMPNPNLMIDERHDDTLKGLVWCCAIADDLWLPDALAKLALSAYRKVPGVGPRATKVGNACVHALGEIEGEGALGALALLKVRVKFGTAQKGIAKALDAAAVRAGLTREELEEIGVPAYGLGPVGLRREPVGEGHAELRIVSASRIELCWVGADGKTRRSVPKAVSRQHAEALRRLKAVAKDAEKMLVAQAARLERLYLACRAWRVGDWRSRYLAHPLVGTLARRLVWQFELEEHRDSGCWHDGGIIDRKGEPLGWLRDDAQVHLWHPILDAAEAALEWRTWLESREIAQPFKQVHREIYRLSPAERASGIHSNRFASRVLKQHQFNALCAARGWRNKLRLLVDDEYGPAMLELPAWNLRAELWVEGMGKEFGTDTTEAGAFLYLKTDQVRFYPLSAAPNWAHAMGGGYSQRGGDSPENAPLPLEAVPPLVLSEVFRDVELFVGVAGVGNEEK